jgi:hypothetical protein
LIVVLFYSYIPNFCLFFTGNPTARSSNDAMRIPLDRNDPACLGMLFLKIKHCTPAGCKNIYNFPLKDKARTHYACQGSPHMLFGAGRMGENTIAKMLPDLCRAAGIEDWNTKAAHSLRRFGITQLANDPHTNTTEVARAARHTSARSQEAYIATSESSEMARIHAFGILPRSMTAAPRPPPPARLPIHNPYQTANPRPSFFP